MDARYLKLAARCLEDSVATTREPPKAKKGEKAPKRGKNDIELKGKSKRGLLYSILVWLSLERDHSKAQPEEPTKAVADLGRSAPTRAKLPCGITSGIKRLKSKVARLSTEDDQVKEGCKTTECETVLSGEQKGNKNNEVKGTKEKVEDTKQVVDEEESEAKEVVKAKQPSLGSQANMKKEHGDALIAVPK